MLSPLSITATGSGSPLRYIATSRSVATSRTRSWLASSDSSRTLASSRTLRSSASRRRAGASRSCSSSSRPLRRPSRSARRRISAVSAPMAACTARSAARVCSSRSRASRSFSSTRCFFSAALGAACAGTVSPVASATTAASSTTRAGRRRTHAGSPCVGRLLPQPRPRCSDGLYDLQLVLSVRGANADLTPERMIPDAPQARASSAPRTRPKSTMNPVATAINCLIADDHEVVREGLRLALSRAPHIRVIGEAVDGESAVALAERRRPDLIVMDLRMGGIDGVEATKRIRQQRPALPRDHLHRPRRAEPAQPRPRGGCRRLPAQGGRAHDHPAGHRARRRAAASSSTRRSPPRSSRPTARRC